MYESFFKLKIKPFELVPDPHFIYLSKSHKKALTYLDYGIKERSGFILLTGEVGSGKTTLIRNLLDKHYERAVLSKVFNTRVTSEQLLEMINDDFGLATQGKDKVTLIRDLNSFLVEQYALGNQPILIIDEAQNLDVDILEEVRMLSNLEASDCKLLQIILVGQPELRQTLSVPELRQLRQRININCHLHALNREEVEQYIVCRLEMAGNASAANFSPGALDAIYHYSKGVPRLINIICDFLLLSAFADETTDISVEMVQDVTGDLDFENYYWLSNAGPEETSRAPDAAPITAGNQAVSDEMLTMITDISRRLESIETMLGAPLQTALKERDDRFASLQSAVSSHVATTGATMRDLNEKLEDLKKNVNNGEQRSSNDVAKAGFIRRVFGGGSLTK